MNRVGMIHAAHCVLCLPLLCSLLPLPLAAAQKQATRGRSSPNDAYKLIALKVTGTARYSDQEILAASGLQIGQNAADGDFKEAVQRLGNSGLFSDVAYTYSSSGAGVKLELQLTDVDTKKLVPAHFENFVWFTDDQLQTALRRRVPLLKQVLPLAGNLPDRITEALQAILTEKQFPGRVNYLREGDESGGALRGIDYRVEEVGIRIHGVEFPGASPEQAALLTTAAHRLTGSDYGRSSLAAVAKFDLLPVYLQRGYLKAAFAPSDARVLPQPTPPADTHGPAELEVDAILPVTPGKVYATSVVDWKGNSALRMTEIAPMIHLQPGQPADAVRLSSDLDKVRRLYRSRGYMMAQINPDAQLDDEKSTVQYQFTIVEGELYKMGELEVLGLDTQAKARVMAAWALREGEPYNAEYPKKFIAGIEPLLPRGAQWTTALHETPDTKAKTVDVEIRFQQR